MRRIRGAKGLVFDGISEITSLVERTALRVAEQTTDHVSVVPPLAPAAAIVRTTHGAITRSTCHTIRAISRGVEAIADVGLDAVEARRGDSPEPRADEVGTVPWALDQVEGALNGVLGDYLAARGNPLATPMTLRHDGRAHAPAELAATLAAPTNALVIFVHGLATTEWCWQMHPAPYPDGAEHTYASLLERDLGYTPFHVRYNTGQPILDSGRQLADLLEELVQVYPNPVARVVLVGHSMGGLVSRSAALIAADLGHAWVEHLSHIVCLGSPHHGAPLERLARGLQRGLDIADVAATRVISEILDARSLGINDLGDGESVEARRLPGVTLCLVGATITGDVERLPSALLGDLLVPTSSSTGEHLDPDHVALFSGINHIQLTNHPAVYPTLRDWLDT